MGFWRFLTPNPGKTDGVFLTDPGKIVGGPKNRQYIYIYTGGSKSVGGSKSGGGQKKTILDRFCLFFCSWPKIRGGQIAQNRSKSDDKNVDSVRNQHFFNAGLTPHSHSTTSHELKIGHPPGFLLFEQIRCSRLTESNAKELTEKQRQSKQFLNKKLRFHSEIEVSFDMLLCGSVA